LDLNFDPTVLEFVEANSPVNGLLDVNDDNAPQGELSLGYINSGTVSTPISAATVTFSVLSGGDGNIGIVETESSINDGNDNSLNTIFEDGNVTTQSGGSVASTQAVLPRA
jgi:hypothetical protein